MKTLLETIEAGLTAAKQKNLAPKDEAVFLTKAVRDFLAQRFSAMMILDDNPIFDVLWQSIKKWPPRTKEDGE